MDPFTCLICGETYLGGQAPDRCPFCGANGAYLVPSALYVEHGAVELSEQSRKDCQEALQLELNNQSFYLCASENAENQVTKFMFKRLSKQEAEHAELLCEMMGIDEPDPPEVECAGSDAENFAEANRREKRAANFYLTVATRAPEERVKQVFQAIAEIEGEHLKVSNIYGGTK